MANRPIARVNTVLGAALLGLFWLAFSGPANALPDDHAITLSAPAQIAARRQALIQFIWGPAGFPAAKVPSAIHKGVASPVAALENLKRVDEIEVAMDAGQQGLAYHFIAQRTNHRLVILHHGHACTFNDSPALADEGYGMQRTIDGLLFDGYSVLAVYMPHQRPGDCGSVSHDSMFALVTTGSPMKFFLEPVAVCLHYLKTRAAADGFPVYQDFSMIGLSGGGWTTTVYAAIDPTISLSFPVAGSIPLYLRSGGSVGDTEQFLPEFYRIAGYPDLYVLGSYGPGRKQVQILNRHDACCFGETQHDAAQARMPWEQAMRSYEANVRLALYKLGSGGSFRLEIDEPAPDHQISHNSVVGTILAELNGGRRYVGASSSTDAFVRSMNGHLWHNGVNGWEDTRFAMVGVPAVLQGAVHTLDVFFRDPGNQLLHVFPSAGKWVAQRMNGVIITDPVAASWGANRFDVVALGTDYKLYHWWWNGGGVQSELISSDALGLGPPALVTSGANHLDLFFRGWDRTLYHVRSMNGSAPWTLEKAGGTLLDFPSALATGGGTLRAYIRGASSQLWEAVQVNGGAWQWTSLSAASGSLGTPVAGSPSASVKNGTVTVSARTAAGNLATFTFLAGKWTFASHGGNVSGSPTAIPGGALICGQSGALFLFDGASWIARGGIFD